MYKKNSKKTENKRIATSILAIAAGKGGVGKSTVTVHLATALAKQGFRVGILDSDVYGPSLKKMLREDRPPSQRDSLFIPALSFGIEIMSMSYFRKQGEAAAVRAPIANGIITDFLTRVAWSDLDFLLIDFPPGTGDIQITLCQKASIDGAILVTTPQEVASIDVQKCAHLFSELCVPILGVVENMSYYTPPESSEKVFLFGSHGGDRLAKDLNLPLLGQIPIEPLLSASGDSGIPLSASDPLCPVSLLFSSIAKEVQLLLSNSSQMGNQVTEIQQLDDNLLSILWNDGQKNQYRISHLQEKCPCAQCAQKTPNVDPQVSVQDIQQVGRYAIRITFTSGCSQGIYDYALLRKGL